MNKLRILFVSLMSLTASISFAHDFEVNGIYYKISDNDNKTVAVTKGDYSSSVTIPESVTYENTTYSVTSIDWYAFDGCNGLTSVTIPESVISIGFGAFFNTGIYSKVSNWENGVLYISNCLIDSEKDWIGHYTIKENTRLIAAGAFHRCTGLTSVTIPNSVTSIGQEAFSGCYTMTDVTIGDSVTAIGDFAFEDCTDLTSIYAKPTTPPICGRQAFDGINKSECKLYVKKESLDAYKGAPQWKEFILIEERNTK